MWRKTWGAVVHGPVSSWLDRLWASAMSNQIVTNLIWNKNSVVSLANIWNTFELWPLITWWSIGQFLLHWSHSGQVLFQNNDNYFILKPKLIGCEFGQFMRRKTMFYIWSKHLKIGCDSMNIVPWHKTTIRTFQFSQ